MQQQELNSVAPKCQLLSLDLGAVVYQGQTAQLAGKFILPCPVIPYPQTEQLSDEYLRWMVENGLIDQDDVAKYETLKLSNLCTSALSDLPIHVAKYLPICSNLLWIIDNPLEAACKKIEDIEALKCICDLIVKCLEGKYAEFKEQDSHPAYKYKEVCFQDNLPILCRALDRFQREIRDYATFNHYVFFDGNWQRFCEAFRFCLDGSIWASAEKIKKNYLQKNLYLKLREATSAATIICILGATLLDLNLSKVIQENHVIFRTMLTLGNLLISMMNDIVSSRGEIKQVESEGTYNENFIINEFQQLKSKTGHKVNPLQGSIACVIKTHNKMMFNFLSLLGSAKNIYKTPDASRFFESILQHIRDHFEWNLITSRYGLEKLFVIQDKRIVNLNQVEAKYLEDPCRTNIDTQTKPGDKSYFSDPNTFFGSKNKAFSDEAKVTNDKLPWNFTIGRSKW